MMDDKTKKLVDAYGLSLAGRYVASVEIDTVSNARAALNAHISALLAERDGLKAQVVQYAELHAKVLEALGVSDAVFMHGQDPVEAAKEIVEYAINAEAERERLRAENERMRAALGYAVRHLDGYPDELPQTTAAVLSIARAALNPADKEPT